MSAKRFTLVTDFEDEIYHSLYALHTSVEGYQLAYKLNQFLTCQLSFCSEKEGNQSDNISFERYVWQPNLGDPAWELIANSTKIKVKKQTPTLFQSADVEKKEYLISAMKHVDFWLKIPQSTEQTTQIKSVESLEEVQLIYQINDQKIKQNPNLIFD